MTVWDVLRSLLRRWYVLLGTLLVAAAACQAVLSVPPTYWSRAEVTFLAPSSEQFPNTLRTRSSDLVVTAGLVARQINGNLEWNKMADPAATIVGEGVLDGWAVRLPDHGGQWSVVYPRQVLDVQVSGADEATVRARQRALVEQIDTELAALQQDVVPSDRITTVVVPEEPNVYELSGDKRRALLMACFLAGAGGLAATAVLETASRRRRARRAAAGLREPSTV